MSTNSKATSLKILSQINLVAIALCAIGSWYRLSLTFWLLHFFDKDEIYSSQVLSRSAVLFLFISPLIIIHFYLKSVRLTRGTDFSSMVLIFVVLLNILILTFTVNANFKDFIDWTTFYYSAAGILCLFLSSVGIFFHKKLNKNSKT